MVSAFKYYCLYMTIISAFTGTLVMAVSVGPIQLFPYRILLIFMWFLLIISIFINNGRLKLSHIRMKLYFQFLFLWLFYAFLSMAWAAAQIDAIRNVIFLFKGISIIFFFFYYASDLNRIKQLYWLWLFIFIALIPIGVWEVLTGNHLKVSNLFLEQRVRCLYTPTAVFHNQNDFAGYIALTLPMVIAWCRYYPILISRVLGVIVFIAGLWLLIMTFSRSCYLAVFTGLIFQFIFLMKLNKKIKVSLLIALLFAFIVIVFPSHTQNILKTIGIQVYSLMPLITQNEDMNSISIRQNLIKNAFYFTFKSAGFGVGAGNVEYYMENAKIYQVASITNVHNWWMEIMANYGVFIFTGYLIFYF
ncbi:MAG: O-antigen ligase family protein, partial [Desulfovibrionales bacterium]|nr:O-antigen ligase family protein [Desulfovibrionales bacterium]